MRNALNADQSKGTVATTQDVPRHHQSCIAILRTD